MDRILAEWLTGIDAGVYEKNRKDMYQILCPLVDYAIADAKRLKEINQGNYF